MQYFLEDNNQINKDIKGKDDVKKQSCLNLCNSEETKEDCEMEKNEAQERMAEMEAQAAEAEADMEREAEIDAMQDPGGEEPPPEY